MTPYVEVAVEQRTEAWERARLGRLTGTRANAMLSTVKSGESAGRRDLRTQLALEQLTGVPHDDVYVSKEMQHGLDTEAAARAAYEAATGRIVTTPGFLQHPTLLAGLSPDGLIGTTGVLEVKCPKAATHLATLRSRAVPTEYLGQVRHALWITGAEWCDFASFDDRFPRRLRLVVVRTWARDVDLLAYGLVVSLFLSEVGREVQEIEGLAA